MSVLSINKNLPSYINLPNRAERINAIDNRITANNRQIVALENQIAAQKEVSSVTREMIANNTNSINLTKDIISLKKEIVGNNEKIISNNEKRIANNTDTINLTKQLISNNEKLIGAHKEQRGLLQESRDLTKESRDLAETRLNNLKETQVLAKQAIDCIEKMLAIMMKNPAKYGGLDKSQFQQLPEVVEAKKNLTDVVAIKLNQYPKEEHEGLMDTAKKVIDRSFRGINTTDLSSNKKIFSNLEKNIDTALAEQYTLKKEDYMSTIRNYRIIQKLFHNFSSLSIKNFKI